MVKFENIGKGVLVSYDEEGIKKYLEKKGENLARIEEKGYLVETFFEEDELMLVMLDLRAGQKEAKMICFQDFYINTDGLIEIHDSFKAKTQDQATVDIYKLGVHKIASVITMIPTFQEYYYRHNLAYPSKIFTQEPLDVKMEKAA